MINTTIVSITIKNGFHLLFNFTKSTKLFLAKFFLKNPPLFPPTGLYKYKKEVKLRTKIYLQKENLFYFYFQVSKKVLSLKDF